MIEDLWYENAIIYALNVDSYMDGNGDGCGDFEGLTRRLAYLDSLGVDAIWIGPFHSSPNRDDGYDIADFYSVDKRLGSNGDYVEFMNHARSRGCASSSTAEELEERDGLPTLRGRRYRSRLRSMSSGSWSGDRRGQRSFLLEGELWSVSERDASGVPGARAPMCLVYESQAAVRRAWSFPPNWRDMEDDALWRLSELIATKSALIDGLQTAFITSIVAQESTNALIARAKGVLGENRLLRDQLKASLLSCRAARRETHNGVANYAREERDAGRSATDVLRSLDAPLQRTAFVVSDPERTDRLMADVARWCDEEFRAA